MFLKLEPLPIAKYESMKYPDLDTKRMVIDNAIAGLLNEVLTNQKEVYKQIDYVRGISGYQKEPTTLQIILWSAIVCLFMWLIFFLWLA